MINNFVKKIFFIKVVTILFIICLIVLALYKLTTWYKKTSAGDLMMVGMYTPSSGQYGIYKPLILSINPFDFSIKRVDLNPLGLNITGIHEARTFIKDGKYKIALATYQSGKLIILGSNDRSFNNLKEEFEDKLADKNMARALFIGDVNNDGKDEIIIGTRPFGTLKYYQFKNGKWSGSVIDEVGATIHDLLITDSEGDGKKEIFVTTSATDDDNVPLLKLTTYIPKVFKYKFDGTVWNKEVVWEPKIPILENGVYVHARYIFSGDFDGHGPELVAGVIGESGLHSLLKLKWNGAGYTESLQNIDKFLPLSKEVIASGDVDGDGRNEIIAPTLAGDAIMIFKWQGNGWETNVLTKNLIDASDNNQKIISMTVLDSTSGGYKNILYVTARPYEGTSGKTASNNANDVTRFYLLSHDPKKNEWNKKLVNTITFTDIESWGIFPMSTWKLYNQ